MNDRRDESYSRRTRRLDDVLTVIMWTALVGFIVWAVAIALSP